MRMSLNNNKEKINLKNKFEKYLIWIYNLYL